MSIFGTGLTVLTTLAHLYLFFRLDSLLQGWRRYSRKDLVAVILSLWLLFVFGRMHGGGFGFLSQILQAFSMHWMASLFLISVGLFIADLASGFGRLFPRQLKRIRTVGLACGLILVVTAHVQGLRAPVLEQYELTLKSLPASLDGTRVLMMADWHAGEMMIGGAWLGARVDQAMAQKPDLILLAGDLFERGTGPEEMIPAMQRLSAPLGVWAVRGNHDAIRPGRRDVTGEILNAVGIRLLSNERVEIADGLLLAGIDDLTASRRNPGEGVLNINRALSSRPQKTTLLLSHSPWQVERAAAAGVDLMLSAHTHNGQIWPFNYLVKIQYPYISGQHSFGGMRLLISRGTGTWGPRMRLWARSEISLITLRSQK